VVVPSEVAAAAGAGVVAGAEVVAAVLGQLAQVGSNVHVALLPSGIVCPCFWCHVVCCWHASEPICMFSDGLEAGAATDSYHLNEKQFPRLGLLVGLTVLLAYSTC
jgi:hypothetical protein